MQTIKSTINSVTERLQDATQQASRHDAGMRTQNVLAEIIGQDAYLALQGAVGGCDLFIPATLGNRSAQVLIDAVGLEATEALIAWGGPCRVFVPRDAKAERARRVADLVELRRQGLTVEQIALQYRFTARLSERAVYQILKG